MTASLQKPARTPEQKEQNAQLVKEKLNSLFGKLSTYLETNLEYIQQLKADLKSLQPGESIMGANSWKEWCQTHLNHSGQAVTQALLRITRVEPKEPAKKLAPGAPEHDFTNVTSPPKPETTQPQFERPSPAVIDLPTSAFPPATVTEPENWRQLRVQNEQKIADLTRELDTARRDLLTTHDELTKLRTQPTQATEQTDSIRELEVLALILAGDLPTDQLLDYARDLLREYKKSEEWFRKNLDACRGHRTPKAA